MSRRRLSFRGVTETSPTENTVTDGGNACSLCLAPHTQLSVPAAWKNTRARELALTDLQLTLQSAVCRLCRDDIGRLIETPMSHLGGKNKEMLLKKN